MKLKKGIAKISMFITILLLISLFSFQKQASSNSNIPDIDITTTTTSISAGVNEEFSIKYTFSPQPIPVNLISPKTEKEIVLVIDTSGSMDTKLNNNKPIKTRLEALKDAANSFITQFDGDNKTKIAIVTYNSRATLIRGLTTDKSDLKTVIKGLKAEGGTNIGDGMRVAMGLLKEKNSAKKYIVSMTDGDPTAFSYTKGIRIRRDLWYNLKYYEDINTYTGKEYYKNNNSDEPILGMEYSLKIAKRVKEIGYKNYLIGFSDGVNGGKMNQISGASGGIYKEAKSADDIKIIYDEIADEIKADYSTEEVKLNFTLPSGITYSGSQNNLVINGSNYTLTIPDIIYNLNSKGTYYEALPFDIILTFRATKNGSYSLGGDNWFLSYNVLYNTILKKLFPPVSVNVSKLGMNFEINRNIIGNTSGKLKINQEFTMEYSIKPQPIKATQQAKAKEVILVLDTSSSMAQDMSGGSNAAPENQKITILKNTAKDFVERLKGNNNVNVGIVSYNSGATAHIIKDNKELIPSSEKAAINSVIDDLKLGEGSNTGDGIRKALWLLQRNTNTEKYIVVIGDGTTDYFTYDKSSNNYNPYTFIDNESSSGSKVAYGLGNAKKSEDYAMEMASKITIQSTPITPYFISLGANGDDNLFKLLLGNKEGRYIDCRSTDPSVFNNAMLDISDEVRSEFIIKNSYIQENLPVGLITASGKSDEVIKLPNLVYVYNSDKTYVADNISVKINLIGKAFNNYLLENDAVINYIDVEKISRKLTFPSFSLSILDETKVMQGLFTNILTGGSLEPQDYLTNVDGGVELAEELNTKIGVLVRNTGESSTLKATINKFNNNIGEVQLKRNNINVYRVNSENELERLLENEYAININSERGKIIEFTVKLPTGDNSRYNYYIVNYDFSAKLTDGQSSYVICGATIEETGKSEDYRVDFVGLPDVF